MRLVQGLAFVLVILSILAFLVYLAWGVTILFGPAAILCIILAIPTIILILLSSR